MVGHLRAQVTQEKTKTGRVHLRESERGGRHEVRGLQYREGHQQDQAYHKGRMRYGQGQKTFSRLVTPYLGGTLQGHRLFGRDSLGSGRQRPARHSMQASRRPHQAQLSLEAFSASAQQS